RIGLPPCWSNETTEGEDELNLPPVGAFPSDTIWDMFACGRALGDFGTNVDVKNRVFGWLIGTSIYKTHSTLGSVTPSVLSFGLGHKSEVDRAISLIEEFRSREDGWKGPNSFGPTKRTIEDAKTFAAVALADGTIEPPHIGLAADGEITFFWQNPKITIDLTIAGDGTYAYFGKLDVGQPLFEDAAPVTENFPEKILKLIRRIA
ncbi:MAG: hypothetical protein ACREDR_35825, partial [Blastocatellia bacterium]